MAKNPTKALYILFVFMGLVCGGPSHAIFDETKLIPAEQAFILQVHATKNKDIELYWEIAPGYYLYRDQLKVINSTNYSLISNSALPAGTKIHDKTLGEYTVYADKLIISIPWSDKLIKDNLLVHYQGCAKNGFCYEPVYKQVYFNSEHKPQLKDITQQEFNSHTNDITETDKLAATIKNRFLPISLGIFFVLGVLLSFSPCVWPMIPLVVNLLVGSERISSRKAVILASSYVLGMAGSYAVAGMLVGVLGSTLQTWLQQPLILIMLSCVLVVLALMQFEIIHISLPHFNKKLHHWGQQQLQGSVLGAFILGVIASLIISPCTTPPLIGALTYIGQNGNPIVGAITLFSLGLGMGVPLIVVAVLSSVILPKIGIWMNLVKSITGVALLGLAIWLIERFISPDMSLILWGALCIVAGVFLKAFQKIKNAKISMKIIKIFGLLLTILGSMMIVTALKHEYRPISVAQWHNISLIQEFDRNLAEAKANHKPAIVEFYADWCTSCKKIETDVFSDANVSRNLQAFVLLRVDLTVLGSQQHELMNRFKIYGPPAILFFDKDGKEIFSKRVVGDVSVDEMLKLLQN